MGLTKLAVHLKVKHMAGKHSQASHNPHKGGSGGGSSTNLPKPEPGKNFVRLDPSEYNLSKGLANDNAINRYEINDAQKNVLAKKIGKVVLDTAQRDWKMDMTEREANVIGSKYRTANQFYATGTDNIARFIRDQVRALDQGD